jgi:hypothetical protein
MPFEDVYGNGGLLTTVNNLLSGIAISGHGQAACGDFKLMQQSSTLNSGSRLGYGFGLLLNNYEGVAEIAHTGTTAAYVA